MQYEDFEDNQLQFVQNWVRLNTEGYDSHRLEDSEEKDQEGGGVESDYRETSFSCNNLIGYKCASGIWLRIQ